MLGQVTNGIFVTAQRRIHDLPVLGGNVTRSGPGDLADQARQPRSEERCVGKECLE